MNHPLHISKEDRDALIRVMAEMLMQRINFNPAELIVIPTATVAQWTGLSPKSVQRRFPITIGVVAKNDDFTIFSLLKNQDILDKKFGKPSPLAP